MFSYDDVKLLRLIMAEYRDVRSTPHVLAEVSNFTHQAWHDHKTALLKALQTYTSEPVESGIPSAHLVKLEAFEQLGVTDAGLVEASLEAVVATTDFHLAARIRIAGGDVINFVDLQNRRLEYDDARAA